MPSRSARIPGQDRVELGLAGCDTLGALLILTFTGVEVDCLA
jgi:hypothetical protein